MVAKKVRSLFRSPARFAAPLSLFLAGMAVPVALGAARPEPQTAAFGQVGIHRLLPNSLVFEHHGEVLVVNYVGAQVPRRYGLVTMTGTLRAVPLRVALEEVAKRGAQSAGDEVGGDAPGTDPGQGSGANREPRRQD